jgi:enterochelin esterase-like enzyme
MSGFSKMVLSVVLCISGLASAQQEALVEVEPGTVIENLQFEGELLDHPVDYVVYLPPGYDESERSYPVVYLLHGFTDEEWAWIQFGEAHLAADRAIASRKIPPMIIVMPDGGVTWYVNDYAGEEPWADMFIQEFIPHIENEYRIRKQKEFRAISGLSMGGWGALHFAMNHPDLFAVSAPFSAGVRTDEEMINIDADSYQRVYGGLFAKNPQGKERLNQHFNQFNPLHLARTLPEDRLRSVRWYIDCGDDDFLFEGNSELHVVLRKRGIPHEYRVRDGAHNWTYWRTGIADALEFIGESFHR